MVKYISKRLIMLPPVLLGVSFLLFLLTARLSPQMRAALYIKDARQMANIDQVINQYGLNDPLIVQYGRWLKGIAKGDFGYSETAKMPVSAAIKAYLPASVQLAVCTMIMVIFFGVWLGILSAQYKDKFLDNFLRMFSLAGFSVPIFVLGLLLLMFFYGKLRWFPPGELGLRSDIIVNNPAFKHFTGFLLIDSLLNLKFFVFLDTLRHLILPSLTLCLGSFALMVRVMRSSMLEEFNKDYIKTAAALGLSQKSIIYKHAAVNALRPVVTLSSIQFIRLLGGTVIVETVFDYPGIGRWGVQCAQQLDIAGVLGFSLMVACLFVAGNLAADILYTALDPRIRLSN